MVVPEGIIFQSQTAYKQLREMLVKNCLVAIVSLPAGVFNPYSGVKTSILVLDKQLVKQRKEVLFVKIENDGFNLGAQRRPIDKNDLPEAVRTVKAFLQQGEVDEHRNVLAVSRERIEENGEWNLSGERYRENADAVTKYPMVTLAEVAEFFTDGNWVESKDQSGSGIRLIQTGNIGVGEYLDKPKNARFISEDKFDELNCTEVFPGDVLVSRLPDPVGRACLAPNLGIRQITAVDCSIIRFDPSRFLPELFVAFSKSDAYYKSIEGYLTGATRPRISRSNLGKIEIPLPPSEVQKEIVAEIEGYQKIIDGARQVVDNYQPRIPIHPDWPMVELGEIIERLETGVSVNSENRSMIKGESGILKTSCVTSGEFVLGEHKAILPGEMSRARCNPRADSIIISRMNTEALVGANAYVDRDYKTLFLPDRLWQTVIERDDVKARYVQLVISSKEYRAKISALCGGTSGSMKNISKVQFLSLRIPLPPLEIQNGIVSEIEAEQRLVNASKELIHRFEEKINQTINRVWGEAE